MSRILVALGILLIVIGLLWPWLQKMGLGRLPGDLYVEKENVKFYFPIVTSIVISIILTAIFWFFRK